MDLVAGNDTTHGTVLVEIAKLIKQAREHSRWRELDTAERLASEARELARTQLGEKHQSYAYALQEHGIILESQDKIVEARDAYMASMEILEPLLGNSHPDTLWLFERLYHLFR